MPIPCSPTASATPRAGRSDHARPAPQRVTDVQVHRLAAFTTDRAGGNPAGVVITDTALDADRMLQAAAEVNFSETAAGQVRVEIDAEGTLPGGPR